MPGGWRLSYQQLSPLLHSIKRCIVFDFRQEFQRSSEFDESYDNILAT